jgi:hypothetical protein
VLLIRATHLALHQLAEAIGNHPLTCITAVQIDQRGPGTAVAHPVHQRTQQSPGRSRERVASMAEIMEMRSGPASHY